MWTAIDADLPHHPKTFDLARLMAWGTPETVGRLTLLWLWALRFADDGDLREHGAHRIAGAMDVPMDDAERLLSALIEARWIDREPYLRLHGWWARQGYFLRTRWKDNPSRWQRVQQLYTPKESVADSVTPSVTDGVTDGEKHRKTPEERVTPSVPEGVAGGVAPVTATAHRTNTRQTKNPAATAEGTGSRKPRQLRLAMGAPAISAECQAVVDAWNALGTPFPAVRALTPERCAALAERMGEPFFVANWRGALDRMAASPFHRGGGARRWVANLDWFVGRPEAAVHLMELPAAELIDAAAAARRGAF